MQRSLHIAAALLVISSASDAHDALQGKRIYLDAARIVGSTVSCVDCHGGFPPGLFGIGRAANQPAIVSNAINTIPQMTPLRGRLSAQQIADVAAYLGDPMVASPTLSLATIAPGGVTGADRLDFGTIALGQASARGIVRLSNAGALSLQLTSSPRVLGPQATEFAITDGTCVAAATLGAGESCEIGLTFRPAYAAAGLRSGAVQIDHDWVGGTAATALLGIAESSAANPPVAASSGGGGALGVWLLVGVATLTLRRAL